ncbi:MAG: acetyl-CoA synthase subunit gamma [Bacteroidetes bacterium]|nr:acetyl-CoA synthase subunit gamma [Bacteroidota bacterium]MBL6963655.1 acetyl-CoA synthase subunit gamma [Bacteroidota bacterium]
MKLFYITAYLPTSIGEVPVADSKLNFKDRFGALMVRLAFYRNSYKVNPGLYAVGNPDGASDVFVTANYKLSFDHLRKNLDELNAWILVLDTRGINVWCAAGKGTFSTTELVNRIRLSRLSEIINHRKIIVPQLGATGISAHKVEQLTANAAAQSILSNPSLSNTAAFVPDPVSLNPEPGFKVIYGPVKASDIKEFVRKKHHSTKEMRKVSFNLVDRLKLIPVDLVMGSYKLLAVMAVFFILSAINKGEFSLHDAIDKGLLSILIIGSGYVSGLVLTPIFLPFIPGRSFSLKGFLMGIITSALLLLFNKLGNTYLEMISWSLIISGISSFTAMNFTGSSTFTSLSGVKIEMKIAIPFQISLTSVGLVLFVVVKFIN